MDVVSVTRKIDFDYGHRVLGHGGRCRHLHGHRGTAEITVRAQALDLLGMIIDFGSIKGIVGQWINEEWDHNLLLSPHDPQLPHLQITEERLPYVMREGNPTAENMAKELFQVCKNLLPKELTVVRIRLYETPNCWADYGEEE